MRISVRAIALVFGTTLALAACGSSSKPSSSSTTSSTAAGANATTTSGPSTSTSSTSGNQPASADEAACKLITQAEATELFGTPASPKADVSPTHLAKSVCLWFAHPNDELAYLLQMRVYDKPAFYSGGLPGYVPLADVGDKAAIYVLPGGSTIMISYQKGDTVVSISYSVQQAANGSHKSAADQKDQLLALVKQAAGR